jgi:hypothetical protein
MRRASAGAARMRACSDAMPSRPRRALQRRALWPSRCARRGPCNVARAFRVAGNVHTCSTGKVIAVSTFQDSEFPWPKKKERSGTGGGTVTSFQKPARAIQNPDSAPRRGFWNLDRFQDRRYRHTESNLRTSPCDLEIERQNTDSKFRDSSFCLRSCTHASSNVACEMLNKSINFR